MRPKPENVRGRRADRYAVLAVAVALWLAFGAVATAASVSKASGRHKAAAHGHHCKCEEACRGASCCCESDEPKPEVTPAPAPPRKAPSQSPKPDSRPCVKSSPCGGGDGLPGPATAGSVDRMEAVGTRSDLRTVSLGSYLAPPAEESRPARLASRLDEPPEHVARPA